MANSRCVLGLALQLPTRALAVRVGFSGGSLESDVPTVVLVDRTPDLTHSRGTGYLFQPVPASDQLASTHAPPSPPSSQQHCGRSPTDPYCTDSRQSVPGYSPAMASPPSAAVLVRLSPADSGEILTLQRAAYVSEAQAHGDLELPPLVQSLEELAAELADPQVLALGLREGARLLAAVRIRLDGDSADLGRLTVVPDRRVRAWAAACCATGCTTRCVIARCRRHASRPSRCCSAATGSRRVDLRSGAHTLKGACGNVGARKMAEICRELEVLSDAGSMEGAGFLVDELDEEFRRVRNEILQQLEIRPD